MTNDSLPTEELCVCGHPGRKHWFDDGRTPTGRCDAPNCGCSKYRPLSSKQPCDHGRFDGCYACAEEQIEQLQRRLQEMTERKEAVNETLAKVVAERNELRAAWLGIFGERDRDNAAQWVADLLHNQRPAGEPKELCVACQTELPPLNQWSMPACPSCTEKAERASAETTNEAHGPPFTVDRFGSLGECVIAERNWLRKRLAAHETTAGPTDWEKARDVVADVVRELGGEARIGATLALNAIAQAMIGTRASEETKCSVCDWEKGFHSPMCSALKTTAPLGDAAVLELQCLLQEAVTLAEIGDIDENTEAHGWGAWLKQSKKALRELNDSAEKGPWLIADGGGSGEHRYRTLKQGMSAWTNDPEGAIQFARRKDAELFAAEDEDAWCILPVPRSALDVKADPLAHMRWICIHCTTVSGVDDQNCLGCGKPRYPLRSAHPRTTKP